MWWTSMSLTKTHNLPSQNLLNAFLDSFFPVGFKGSPLGFAKSGIFNFCNHKKGWDFFPQIKTLAKVVFPQFLLLPKQSWVLMMVLAALRQSAKKWQAETNHHHCNNSKTFVNPLFDHGAWLDTGAGLNNQCSHLGFLQTLWQWATAEEGSAWLTLIWGMDMTNLQCTFRWTWKDTIIVATDFLLWFPMWFFLFKLRFKINLLELWLKHLHLVIFHCFCQQLQGNGETFWNKAIVTLESPPPPLTKQWSCNETSIRKHNATTVLFQKWKQRNIFCFTQNFCLVTFSHHACLSPFARVWKHKPTGFSSQEHIIIAVSLNHNSQSCCWQSGPLQDMVWDGELTMISDGRDHWLWFTVCMPSISAVVQQELQPTDS